MSTTLTAVPTPGTNGPPAVERLDDVDRPAFDRLLAAHPYAGCVLSARVDAAGSLHPARLGGEVLATRDPVSGELRTVCFVGGSVVPVADGALNLRADLGALGDLLASRPRSASELVGDVRVVRALWDTLGPSWAPARAYRWNQPLLAIDHPSDVPADDDVRAARTSELDEYVPAAAAMFTEELGLNPLEGGGESAYRARISSIVRAGRAFVLCDADGRVVFKAEVGAVSSRTAQVQGVWVEPGHRGHGIATGAMAAVVRESLRLAPAVSLYVNDFNTTARALYERVGFEPVGTLATILF